MSLGSHAWTATPRGLAVAVDLLHLATVGVWAGGLAALVIALPAVHDPPRLARRFSTAAGVCLVAVTVTGVASGWIQVRNLDALTSTTYGQLLMRKVAAFAVLCILGWANRTRVQAATERLASSVRSVVLVELAVVAVIVSITAALIATPPARVTVERPFAAEVTEDGLTLTVTVEPARVGSNEVHFYFRQDGVPRAVDAVEARIQVGDIPPRRIEIIPVSPDHVSAYGADFTSPGTWTMTVVAVVTGQSTTFTLEVPIR